MLFIAGMYVTAQDSTKTTSKYNTNLFLSDGKKIKGEIYSSNDSSIMFKYNVYSEKIPGNTNIKLINVPVGKIDLLKVKKKGSGGKAILIGIAAGALTGTAIGLISGDDPVNNDLSDLFRMTAGQKAILGAIGGGFWGGVIGGLIDTARIRIPINGKHDNYKLWRKEIDGFAAKEN
jgi:hypothetical protein